MRKTSGRADISVLSRRSFITGAVALALAGCTTAGPLTKSAGSIPASERVGTGSNRVGLLVRDEPGNLADGAPDSAYLAAKLATTALAGTPITLEVRRFEAKPAALEKAAGEMARAGVRLLIGPDDPATASLAGGLSRQGVTLVTLGQSGDPGNRLFAAGARQQELAFSASEMKRRGYASIAIAKTTDAVSAAYANALAEAAARVGLKVQFIDASTAASAVTQWQNQVLNGFDFRAIAFATGPARAAEVMTAAKSVAELAGVAVVGNGDWAFGAPAGLGKGFYPSLSPSGLADFNRRFADAYGKRPTLAAAMTYDLVVLGGALPQVAGEDPFGPTTMTIAQGFSGVTGGFRFDANGVAQRSFSAVELK